MLLLCTSSNKILSFNINPMNIFSVNPTKLILQQIHELELGDIWLLKFQMKALILSHLKILKWLTCTLWVQCFGKCAGKFKNYLLIEFITGRFVRKSQFTLPLNLGTNVIWLPKYNVAYSKRKVFNFPNISPEFELGASGWQDGALLTLLQPLQKRLFKLKKCVCLCTLSYFFKRQPTKCCL